MSIAQPGPRRTSRPATVSAIRTRLRTPGLSRILCGTFLRVSPVVARLAGAAGNGRGEPACVRWERWVPAGAGLVGTGRGCEGGVAAVAEEPALSFAGLLRQLRAEARLTQEEL